MMILKKVLFERESSFSLEPFGVEVATRARRRWQCVRSEVKVRVATEATIVTVTSNGDATTPTRLPLTNTAPTFVCSYPRRIACEHRRRPRPIPRPIDRGCRRDNRCRRHRTAPGAVPPRRPSRRSIPAARGGHPCCLGPAAASSISLSPSADPGGHPRRRPRR